MAEKHTLQIIKLTEKDKYQRILAGVPQTFGLKSGFVNLKPLEEVGEHSTEDREEAIIIIKGKVEVLYAGNNSLVAEEGSVIYIPPNTKHNLKNIGDKILSYVYVVSPVKTVV